MRILITGGGGCLGSNLIEHCQPKGYEIFVIDNFATGKREVLLPIAGLEVVDGSIADKKLVRECFERFMPTHVIHSAASYKDHNDWVGDVATIVTGTIHVARASLGTAVKRLVNFQTTLCYGRPCNEDLSINHFCKSKP